MDRSWLQLRLDESGFIRVKALASASKIFRNLVSDLASWFTRASASASWFTKASTLQPIFLIALNATAFGSLQIPGLWLQLQLCNQGFGFGF